MKAYQVNMIDAKEFAGTLGLAHAVAKEQSKHEWKEITIEEVEVQTDKEGVLFALNGNAVIKATGRIWGITPRGGLKEEKS